MNICESLSVNANLFPDQIALIFRNEKITYRELNERSIRAAALLSSRGVSLGDRVAIQIGNCPAFPVWYYAILRLGAIAVSISTRLSGSERTYIVEHSDAKVLVAENIAEAQIPETCLQVFDDGSIDEQEIVDGPQVENTWYDAHPNEPALILYTSGTTGFPKGATLSHANVRSNVAAFNHLCQMKTDDRVLLAVPLFHCFGQNALLNSVLNVGGTLVLQQRFDLNESRELIQRHQVTQLYGVPMMFQLLLESCHPDELNSVRYCFSAAAPLAVQTAEQWQKKFGQPIYEGYGLTETSPFASYNHRNKFILGSIGVAIDSVEMKVVDSETGETCQPGQLGEIAIRGPNVMLGYWNQPEETRQAIRDDWFYSGDIGKQDSEGYFYIVDRVKDMIAVGGMKVFPAEVERVLLDQEGVLDAAVVGVEEPVLGEQVIAFVVLEPRVVDEGKTAEDVIDSQRLKQELASYKTPRRIWVVDELPRNPSGKILKTSLRERAKKKLSKPSESADSSHVQNDDSDAVANQKDLHGEGAFGQIPETASRMLDPGLFNRLQNVHPAGKKEVIASALEELVVHLTGNVDDLDRDQTFLELGMDSLMLVELGTQLQLELQATEPLPATLIFDYPRIDELAGHLLESIESQVSKKHEDISTLEQPSQPGQVDLANAENGLVEEIEGMSEEEALAQLMKELE